MSTASTEHPFDNPGYKYPDWPTFLMEALAADLTTLYRMSSRFSGAYRDAMVNEYADNGDPGMARPEDDALDHRLSNGNGTGDWGKIETLLDIVYDSIARLKADVWDHTERVRGNR